MHAAWSQRWNTMVEDAGAAAARRLEHGRTLVRAGRVTDLRVGPGWLSGKVQGSRATPFAVEITVEVLDDDAWATVVAVIAGEVGHVARLLAGHAPAALLDDLDAAGVVLLPPLSAFDQTCPCGERRLLCAHASALWAAVGARLDDDPFLLLHLRGRGRERLLQEVAHARRPAARANSEAVPRTTLPSGRWRGAGAPLDDLHAPISPPPRVTAAPLRVLGDPPGWRGQMSAYRLLSPLVAAAARARAAARKEAEER